MARAEPHDSPGDHGGDGGAALRLQRPHARGGGGAPRLRHQPRPRRRCPPGRRPPAGRREPAQDGRPPVRHRRPVPKPPAHRAPALAWGTAYTSPDSPSRGPLCRRRRRKRRKRPARAAWLRSWSNRIERRLASHRVSKRQMPQSTTASRLPKKLCPNRVQHLNQVISLVPAGVNDETHCLSTEVEAEPRNHLTAEGGASADVSFSSALSDSSFLHSSSLLGNAPLLPHRPKYD